MRRIALIACTIALSGCASSRVDWDGFAESVCDSIADSLISALFGEDEDERRDRETLESHRDFWATPGRTPDEIEVEAQASFRRSQGREPNVNWHAR